MDGIHKTYAKLYDDLSDIATTVRLLNLQKGLDSFRKETGDTLTSSRLTSLQERLQLLKDEVSRDTKVIDEIDSIITKLKDADILQYTGKIEDFDTVTGQIDDELRHLLRYCNNKLKA